MPALDPNDPTIYDESKVPAYTLPDALVLEDGTSVADASTWLSRRRPEILSLFAHHVYGQVPAAARVTPRFEITDHNPSALGGAATRKQITIHFTANPSDAKLHLLLYTPNHVQSPAPVFVSLNINGNHTTFPDPGIHLASAWLRNNETYGVTDNRASDVGRGKQQSRWPMDQIVARGWAIATAYYGDLFPDDPHCYDHSVLPFLSQDPFAPAAPAAIAAWAWGLSRAADYLASDPALDPKRICVTGHSRLGKAALWAGALDPRFALVVSNCSGCGGAALSRRMFGEKFQFIIDMFPHWFTPNFHQYSGRESACPVDQHELLALIAPRPLLVCSAQDDLWADPKGEYLSTFHAAPVYQLFQQAGPTSPEPPALNTLLPTPLSYHIRPGKHDVLPADWQTYIAFANAHLPRP